MIKPNKELILKNYHYLDINDGYLLRYHGDNHHDNHYEEMEENIAEIIIHRYLQYLMSVDYEFPSNN